jgi:pectate lyase
MLASTSYRPRSWVGGLAISWVLIPLLPFACGAPGFTQGWKPNPNQRDGANISSDVTVYTDAPIGWASVSDLGQDGTTGGGDATPVMVATLADMMTAVAGTTPAVVQLTASISGSVKIGSNKTVLGMPGVTFQGHIGVSGAVNVILRNLTVVGNNCNDNPDCQSGADAVTIENKSHHIWVDHCDISDGSDGNMDITSQSDYVTVSWTKLWYSALRPGGHQFSDLIGSSDQATGDAGHLRVTWHHNWWGQLVSERMPRARFGLIHVFNNLYTAAKSSYCVGVGVNVNLLIEDDVFDGAPSEADTGDYSNAQSISASFANLYKDGSNPAPDVGTGVFIPPYDYTLEPAEEVEDMVMANVGPH